MPPVANSASETALFDDDLPLTPNGIPTSLRPCFQEYTLEKLEPERDAFTVIERTLARGDRRELRWLFARYGRERLAEWVRQAGWYLLPKRRFHLWRAYFDIHDYRRNPLGRGAWPHQRIPTGKPFPLCCATCWRKSGRCPSPAASTWLAALPWPCNWAIASRWIWISSPMWMRWATTAGLFVAEARRLGRLWFET